MIMALTWLFTLHRCRLVPSFQSECRTLSGRGTNHSYPFDELGLDNPAIQAIYFVSSREDVPEACVDTLVHLACLGAARPCSQRTNLPVFVCEDSCQLYQQLRAAGLCQEIDEQLGNLALITASDRFIQIFDAFKRFDCTDPSTYFFENITVEGDPDSCSSLFSPQSASKSI